MVLRVIFWSYTYGYTKENRLFWDSNSCCLNLVSEKSVWNADLGGEFCYQLRPLRNQIQQAQYRAGRSKPPLFPVS